jgi:hypothetical protein
MNNPNYYAVIPANVRYNKNLKANEKLLFGEISALSNKNGYCYAAKNDYFANIYGVSKTSISKWISKLVKYGYIKRVIMYKDGSKQILNRYLTIVIDPIEEKLNTPIEEKLNTPNEEKLKDNNTSINNTSINNNDELKNSSDFTSIIKTEKKEKRKKVAQKKENPHYKEFIDIFFEFYRQRVGVEYKFTAIDGKAIKKIIKYIVKIDKNNNPGAAWRFILNSYSKWDKFYQNQLKINQIDSNIANIINQIKNTESPIDYESELQKAYK